ncbi:MAG: hypothetical protein ACPGSO_02840 [Vicingaceae bacterium]
MPKYTRREFYELCGVSKAYIANYIKRGKLILDKDGLLDTSNPYNEEFMQKRVGVDKNSIVVKEKQIKKNETTTKKRVNKGDLDNDINQREEAVVTERYNLERQIKEAELKKKEEEIKKLQAQNAKLSGELIPTELVRVVFAQHFKSVTTAFHQGADNFIAIIKKQTEMTREQAANLKSDLIEIVNQSVDESLEISKDSIDNIVSEYQQVRGKGEKK